MDELIVTEAEWPYGLRCMDCTAGLSEGVPYSKRLVGIASAGDDGRSEGSYPIVEIVCVPCGLGHRAEGRRGERDVLGSQRHPGDRRSVLVAGERLAPRFGGGN
jgi:hypothetical protein